MYKKEGRELVIYKSKVYDVSTFLNTHPGGKKIIEEQLGKPIDKPFDDEGHSKSAMGYFGKRVPQVGIVLDK